MKDSYYYLRKQNNYHFSSIASDLKSSLSLAMKTRRVRVFLYGFGFAFVACTVFFALSGAGNASLSSSPSWFDGVFASTAPYRSQISNFFSFMSPNSTSGSGIPVSGVGGGDLGSNGDLRGGSSNESRNSSSVVVTKGVESMAGQNQTGSGVHSNNHTGVGRGSGGGLHSNNHTGIGRGSGVDSNNQKGSGVRGNDHTQIGSGNGAHSNNQIGGGIHENNQTGSGNGSQGSGVKGDNHSEMGSGSGSGVHGNNQSSSGDGLQGNGGVQSKNQSGGGSVSRIHLNNQTGSGSGVERNNNEVAGNTKNDANAGAERNKDGAMDGKKQVGSGIGLQGGVIQGNNGVQSNNRTDGGVLGKKDSKRQVGSGAESMNRTGSVVSAKGDANDGINQERSKAVPKGNEIAATSQTSGSGSKMKNDSKSGAGSNKEGAADGKIQGGSEVVSKGNGSGSGANNDAKSAAGTKRDVAMAGSNQGASGTGLQGNVAPASNQVRGGGIGSLGNPTPSKDQAIGTVSSGASGVSAGTKHQDNTENAVTSNGSELGTRSKQKEVTPSPQGNGDSGKNHTAQAITTVSESSSTPAKAGNKGTIGDGAVSNYTESLRKGNGKANDASSGNQKKANDDWIKSMVGCDIFQGKWVKDDSYPLYPEGSCPHIDEPFNCYLNGRPDRAYQKLRWQPNGCNIPRLNATDMLERLRGKRLVFVGDSLNRNMWGSLVCALRHSVKDKRKVFEASGRVEFRTEGSYSFLFTDYNCSVEFFRSPFLVQEWEVPVSNGTTKETLRLDLMERSSPRYKDADIIIFNTGHWWTHEKTSTGKGYYQEGNHVYSELNVFDAFHKALNTWSKWIDGNVDSKKSIIFFRGYSASHFSGGQWNSGGQCHKETEPIKNEQYLSSYPPKMSILEDVIRGMKTPVVYLNITRMTDYRKDAHPSIYRKQNLTEEERISPERYQDCSHWCLPGVPDSWNELLYAHLLIKQHQMLQK